MHAAGIALRTPVQQRALPASVPMRTSRCGHPASSMSMHASITRPMTADIQNLGRERRKSVQRNELDAQLCGVLQSKINELHKAKENREMSLASSRADLADLQSQHQVLSRAHAELCSQHADLQREMSMLKARSSQKPSRDHATKVASGRCTTQDCAARSKPEKPEQQGLEKVVGPETDTAAQDELCMLREQLLAYEAKQARATARVKMLTLRQSMSSLATQTALSALRRELRAANRVKVEAESRAATSASAAASTTAALKRSVASELRRAQQEIRATRTRAETAEAGLVTRQAAHASTEAARLQAEHSAQASAKRCAELEVEVALVSPARWASELTVICAAI